MMLLNEKDARCALFASRLQPSECPPAHVVVAAISVALRDLGSGGCLGEIAQEFGDHPEAASERMRWASELASQFAPVVVPWPHWILAAD